MNRQEGIQEIDIEELDSQANTYTIKCMTFTAFAFFIVWLLNTLDVFIVDKTVMTIVFLATSAVMLLPGAICWFTGTRKSWVKYMIMLAVGIGTTIIGSILTFHAVLLFALPLFYAAQYSDRRMIYYAYGMTVISLFVSVMVGYYYGLCDANMLLLSAHPASYYADLHTGEVYIDQINPNPWVTVPLFFVLPRSIILLLFVPVIRNISDNIAHNAVRTAQLQQLGETDKTTSCYNKNKYAQMIREVYPQVEHVAVIFWDINHLKEINDTYGHVHGDYVISSIADCIYELASERRKAYRVGGDEFIMVIENPEAHEAEQVIAACNEKVAVKSSLSRLPLSVAVGCAYGTGRQIQELVQMADEQMYQTKKAMHAAEQNC